MNSAENQVNDLEYKEAKSNQSEQREGKRIQENKESLSSLWENFKRCSIIHIIGVSEEQKAQGIGNLFEKIMKENFPNFMKEIDMQVQKAQSSK